MSFFKSQFGDLPPFFWLGVVFCSYFATISTLYFEGDIFAITASVCGILYALFAGRGKMVCFFFGLVYCFSYIKVSFDARLYGDVILTLIYIPINFFGLYSWLRHQNTAKTSIKIRKLSLRAFILWLGILTLASLVYGFILRHMGAVFAFPNAFSVAAGLIAFYLQTQRYVENYFIITLANIVTLGIWFALFLENQGSFAILFMNLVFLVLGVVYYLRWRREAKITPN